MNGAILAATVFVALLPLGVGLVWALWQQQEQPLRRRAQASQQALQHRRHGFGRVGHER